MRYSLLSRFKGTLLGAVAAETYATRLSPSSHAIAPFSQLTGSVARQLINGQIADTKCNWDNSPETEVYQAIAIAIPIALLAHERKAKLVEQLRLAAIDCPVLDAYWTEALAVSYIIYLSLADKLVPEQLIANISRFLSDSSVERVITFLKVENSLKITTLEEARHQLNGGAIASAAYSFLSTPEDYALTVQRAFLLNGDPMLSALVGAISGAYNGFSSIPANWYLYLDSSQQEDIEDLSEQLFATWSGIYQPQTQVKIKSNRMARNTYTPIAAPQVMSNRRFKV